MKLTPTEARILAMFEVRPGILVTHEQLRDKLTTDANVRVHISRLRDKIAPRQIVVDRPLGYRLVA